MVFKKSKSKSKSKSKFKQYDDTTIYRPTLVSINGKILEPCSSITDNHITESYYIMDNFDLDIYLLYTND